MELDKALIQWYEEHQRMLPWRRNLSPYHVLLSEVMLQQTQVAKVKDYFLRFVKAYPTIQDLAKAGERDVLKHWEGLGYYSRARNLLKLARIVVERYDGQIPSTHEELLKLPGIGPYTANAIRAIAFHQKSIAMDGNLIRVYARLCGDPSKDLEALKKKGEFYFSEHLNDSDPSLFNQALMDLGELVCLPNGKPHCLDCPLRYKCEAYALERQQDFPSPKKRKKKEEIPLTVFVFFWNGRMGICQRPKSGLLASLYELPNIEQSFSKEEVGKRFEGAQIIDLGTYSHVFSHLIWKMRGYGIVLKHKPQGWHLRWLLSETIREKYPLPKAFQVYYLRALEHKG